MSFRHFDRKFLSLFLILFFVYQSLGDLKEENNVTYRIQGGEPADPNLWKFIAVITCGQVFHCGGTLIKPRWVLTAAHCVKGDKVEENKICYGPLKVRVGTNVLSYTKNATELVASPYCAKRDESNTKLTLFVHKDDNSVDVQKVFLHSKHSITQYNFVDFSARDIALLQLLESIPDATLALLPTKPLNRYKSCKVAGWGIRPTDTWITIENERKNDLQQLTVEPLSKKACSRIFNNVDMEEEDLEQIQTYTLCAEPHRLESSSVTPGDSGGPLICENVLHGVTSLHAQKKTGLYPNITITHIGVFCEVLCYLRWINKVFQKNGEPSIDFKDFTEYCDSSASTLSGSLLLVYLCNCLLN